MIAECTWDINGIAGHSTVSDVLRPWPELRHKTLCNAHPAEDDDPGGDCIFGLTVDDLGQAVKIIDGFIKDGAGYSLSLCVYIKTPFGRVEASIGMDHTLAKVYPETHDAKITEAAMAARNMLDKALKGEVAR